MIVSVLQLKFMVQAIENGLETTIYSLGSYQIYNILSFEIPSAYQHVHTFKDSVSVS